LNRDQVIVIDDCSGQIPGKTAGGRGNKRRTAGKSNNNRQQKQAKDNILQNSNVSDGLITAQKHHKISPFGIRRQNGLRQRKTKGAVFSVFYSKNPEK
jgi:hypothetical protein